MNTIWKYPLAVEDRQTVVLPTGAEILTVQVQGEQLCLWARVDDVGNYEGRDIWIVGTGHDLDRDAELSHIDTFQLHGGRLVFHAFEAPHNRDAA